MLSLRVVTILLLAFSETLGQSAPIRINCGGPAQTFHGLSGLPVTWQADTYYTSPGKTSSTVASIAGTEWDALYQTERWAREGDLSYEIPVSTIGMYEVILHFAEIWFTSLGKRVFDVDVEGVPITGVDIVRDGGAPFTASKKSVSVFVQDGFVSIEFQTLPDFNFPKVSAIEVLLDASAPSLFRVAKNTNRRPMTMTPAPVARPQHANPGHESTDVPATVAAAQIRSPPINSPTASPAPQSQGFDEIRINCGSATDFKDSLGQIWEADRNYAGTSKTESTTLPISGTADDAIFQTERWGDFSYELPVPLGDYEIVLWFAEIWFTKPSKRTFGLVVEGRELFNIDIVAQAGGSFTALSREVAVTVSDGALSIAVTFGLNNPKLSALEIKLLAPHLAHSVPGGPYSVVDVNGKGFAAVAVDGSQSHTHAPGASLTTFEWSVGGVTIGSSEFDILLLGVGTHVVHLRVADTQGHESTASTIIHISGPEFPDISATSPSTGSPKGGDMVSILGSGFDAVTSVRFGDFVLLSFNVVSDSLIEVISPEVGMAVPVDVLVVTAEGASSPSVFTYVENMPISFDMKELFRITKPTAVSFGPDRKLYGTLSKITLNSSFTKVVSIVSSTVSPDRFILGIAFHPLETAESNPNPTVYCSSSQLFHGEEYNSGGLSVNGKIHAVSGANLDIVTDVISGLPVSDHDHGVNGIEFGDNGELYILVGGNTNGGIPGKLSSTQHQNESYFSAAALVAHTGKATFDGHITYDASFDGNPITGHGVEVFSSGLRNPFGLVLHSNGNLYATDNGPNFIYGDMLVGCGPGEQIPDAEKGDELNLLIKGAFYGHPNHKRAETDSRQCVWEGPEQTEPLMMLKSSSNAIIEFTSDHFEGQLRSNLIISKYKGGLFRVILSSDGSSVDPISDPAVSLGGDYSLSITQAPNGVIIDSRYISNKLFYFKPKEPASTELTLYAVFPRRGGEAGGSALSIYGKNFPSSPAPKVLVGAKACNNPTRVSETEIKCTLPGGKHGTTVDISVGFGEEIQSTFSKGYRYVKGVE